MSVWLVSRQSGKRVVHQQHRANNVREESATHDRHPERSERLISIFVSLCPIGRTKARSPSQDQCGTSSWLGSARAGERMDGFRMASCMDLGFGPCLDSGGALWLGRSRGNTARTGLQLTTSYAACWQVQCRSKKGKKEKKF